MKLFHFFLSFIYVVFSLMALPMADCGQAEGQTSHACCCSSTGSCSPEMPMDCCMDDGEEQPASPQFPSSQFSLSLPFIASIEKVGPPKIHLEELNSQFSNLPSASPRVKTYIAYHQLVFYA